jgi:HD-GYP domain-containing protein (c-di-GMP phosphodiesterase class II)
MDNNKIQNIISVPQLWKLFSSFLSVMGPTYVDHCVRTAYLVLRLCKKQKLDPEITKKLVFSAYFHDIGSIGKDDAYLMNMDYDILHSVDGYLILKYQSPLQRWARIILYHHVSYDRHINDDPYVSLSLKIAICDRFDDWTRYDIAYERIVDQIRYQSGKAFDPQDVKDMLEIAADKHTQEDIANGRYKDILYGYVNSLEFSPKEMEGYISMLASLFELYDHTTYNHSETVALIGSMLAKYMGYDEETVFKVFLSGLIHDLGKIFMPLSLLNKPAKLTPEEYDFIKTHVIKSKELVKDIFCKEVIDIACNHHERLDGSGYPNHLKHEEMSELEELLQVADVISALIAKRSYKQEYPYEQVIEILDGNVKGGKLNKKIIDVFRKHHEEILYKANEMINEGYKEVRRMKARRKYLIDTLRDKRAKFPHMPLSNFIKKY